MGPTVSYTLLCLVWSMLTQKPCIIVSECAHVPEAWNPLRYTWKRCEVLSSRKSEPSEEMDLSSTMCASPNAKVNGHNYDAVTNKAREEVRNNNR